MNFWKKSPFLLLLVSSGVIFALAGIVNRNGIYEEYKENPVTSPLLASVFMGAKDGVYPWTQEEEAVMVMDSAKASVPEKEEASEETGQTETQMPETTDTSGESFGETAGETAGIREEFANGNETEEFGEEVGDAPEHSVISQEEEEGTYEFTRVEEDYFDDALFIGDSRTQGMLEYGGLEERAAFYCQTSLTVYDLFKKDKAFIKEDGRKVTLTQALSEHQFKKIYLMVGINEMGTGTPDTFLEEYAGAVEKIRQLEPEAVIYVQAIMHVASKKNADDKIFNNANINLRNEKIAGLANGTDTFYLDVNEVVCDENGNLYDDWTFDQIHLKAKYYEIWKEYLLDHGIVK